MACFILLRVAICWVVMTVIKPPIYSLYVDILDLQVINVAIQSSYSRGCCCAGFGVA